MSAEERPDSAGLLAFPLARAPEACPYLAGLTAEFEHYLVLGCGQDAFCRMIERGFRHFGHYYFRPDCPGAGPGGRCGACVPVRVPVADFRPSDSQRRVLRRGAGVAVAIGRPQCTAEKYDIYSRHKGRFREGEGSGVTEEAFRQMLYDNGPFTWECTYTLEGRTIGAGLIDVAARSLSSIYFYFDPEFAPLSPGTLSILYEIGLARSLGIPFYYLGYTIHGNAAMRYKTNFRPCEFFSGSQWRTLRDGKAFLVDPAALRTGPFTPLLEDQEAQ